jgi:hypothetical protein
MSDFLTRIRPRAARDFRAGDGVADPCDRRRGRRQQALRRLRAVARSRWSGAAFLTVRDFSAHAGAGARRAVHRRSAVRRAEALPLSHRRPWCWCIRATTCGSAGSIRASSSSLALFALLGMMVMVSASHFLTLYLGLELLSLSLYAMVAAARLQRRDRGGDEVLRPGRAGLRHAALRHVDGLRRHRLAGAGRHRGSNP